MYGDPEIRGRLQQLGVNLNELAKRILDAPAKPTVPRAAEAATNASLRRSARRIGAAQQRLQGFTQYTKYEPSGELFGAEEGDVGFKPGQLAHRGRDFAPVNE